MQIAATVVGLVEALQEKGIIEVIDSETGESDPGNLEEMAAAANELADGELDYPG